MRRFRPGAVALSADSPTSSPPPPWADVNTDASLAGDEGSRSMPGVTMVLRSLDDKRLASTGLAHEHLPTAPSARRVDETAVVTTSVELAPFSISATHTSRSSEYSSKFASQSSTPPVLVPDLDPSSLPQRVSSEAEPAPTVVVPFGGNELPVPVVSVFPSPSLTRLSPAPDREADGLEKPQEMANASDEDPITALRSQFLTHFAAIELRVGKLELAGKAVPETDVVISFRPDATDAMGDRPEAVADTNLNATMGGAFTADFVQICQLAESMWDSPLFLCRRDVGMGRVVTLWALLVLLLNMVMQTTIAVIVVLNMGDPTFVARIIENLWCASELRFLVRSM